MLNFYPVYTANKVKKPTLLRNSKKHPLSPQRLTFTKLSAEHKGRRILLNTAKKVRKPTLLRNSKKTSSCLTTPHLHFLSTPHLFTHLFWKPFYDEILRWRRLAPCSEWHLMVSPCGICLTHKKQNTKIALNQFLILWSVELRSASKIKNHQQGRGLALTFSGTQRLAYFCLVELKGHFSSC